MSSFEKIAKRLMIKEPFYGIFLLNLNKQETTDIPTLGVCLEGINHKLLINPDFWNTLTDDQQIAVIKHELGHILFKHTTSLYKDLSNHQIANIAMDCEINQMIENLPEGCVTYSGLASQIPGLEEKAGSRYYYKAIYNIEKNSDTQNGDSSEDMHQKYNADQSKCGSHKKWKDFQDLSDTEKELVEQQVDFQAKNTAEQVQRMRGKIPGEFETYINNLLTPRPEVFNWKAYFRRLLGTAEEYYRKTTRKKPSKRFDDAPGSRHIHKQKILVAIDTSGSVSENELRDFFTEINHIYRVGAHIDIAEYDSKLNNTYKYNGKFTGKISGRGGTDFKNSAYLYYLERRRDYSTIVVFTDGYDDYRDVIGNFIFIVTSNGNTNNKYPGKTVFIPNKN